MDAPIDLAVQAYLPFFVQAGLLWGELRANTLITATVTGRPVLATVLRNGRPVPI